MSDFPRILVVDDDPVVCRVVTETLGHLGYKVDSADSGREASNRVSQQTYPIVLCDILLPDTNGLELMSEIKKLSPDTFVILFTGHASVDLAKEAIRQGAYDFMTKPFTNDQIIKAVQRAENEQRHHFSTISSVELRILHELTVSREMTNFSKAASLVHFGTKTAEAFGADSLRIYLLNNTENMLEKTVDIGHGSFADEVTWYFLSSRTMQSGGEILLDPSSSDNPDMAGISASFMGTVIPTNEKNLGVILAGRTQRKDRFKTRDLKLLALYAAQLGNQLQNLKMTENFMINNRELEQINLVTSKFSLSLEISAVIASVAQGIRTFIPFDVAGFFVSLPHNTPYNYVLMNGGIPRRKVFASLKRNMSKNLGSALTAELLADVYTGTFVGDNIRSFENNPEFTFTEVGDYGKIQGWLVMGSWAGRSRLIPSSKLIPTLLRHGTSAICNALQDRENHRNYLETITALAQAVDAKDKYTNDHSKNVTAYALALADEIGITGQARKDLWNAALLHDIGKIGVPEAILNKAGKLTDEEYAEIKTHPAKGCSILKPIKAFEGLLPAIRYHHERIDGKGYPEGIAGSDIPFPARILTVADSFDAMTSNRVYRKSPGVEFALKQLRENSGTQFDRSLAKAFIRLIEAKPYEDILKTYGSIQFK